MVQFYSEHNAAQSRYEQACREANASNQDARAQSRQQIEDNLVAGGWEAIQEYDDLLNERWRRASCIAEYEGVSMGFAILGRAKARLSEMEKSGGES